MREIVLYPNSILRVKTPEVTRVDKDLLANIKDLEEVLRFKEERAAGLATTQIGLNQRFFGLLEGEKKVLKIYINPRIERIYGEKVKPIMVFADKKTESLLEGCLSFPDFFGEVKRYLKIDVSWDEIVDNGLTKKRDTLSGMAAIAFQHESDHLDGILFVDHVKEEGGKIYKWVGNKKVKWDVDRIIGGK